MLSRLQLWFTSHQVMVSFSYTWPCLRFSALEKNVDWFASREPGGVISAKVLNCSHEAGNARSKRELRLVLFGQTWSAMITPHPPPDPKSHRVHFVCTHNADTRTQITHTQPQTPTHSHREMPAEPQHDLSVTSMCCCSHTKFGTDLDECNHREHFFASQTANTVCRGGIRRRQERAKPILPHTKRFLSSRFRMPHKVFSSASSGSDQNGGSHQNGEAKTAKAP